MAIDPQNLAGTATMTFSDEFNTLSLVNGSGGTWDTNYFWGQPNGVTLTNNGEKQWYIDADYAGTQSVKPWSVQDGVLSLTAQNASPEIQSQINGYDYTSGMLTTHQSFSQEYGYFEVSAKLPEGQGLWPAFWLLPEDGSWPPEIDVMEHLGHDPTTYYTAAHTQSTGVHTSQGGSIETPDLTAAFHTYGVNWQPDNLTYYFDGQEVWKTPTPADMDDPMYMLVNLAVGGYWPGDPIASPDFSETMQVDYIRAYTAKPDSEVTAAPSAPTSPATATGTNDAVAPVQIAKAAALAGSTVTATAEPVVAEVAVAAQAETSAVIAEAEAPAAPGTDAPAVVDTAAVTPNETVAPVQIANAAAQSGSTVTTTAEPVLESAPEAPIVAEIAQADASSPIAEAQPVAPAAPAADVPPVVETAAAPPVAVPPTAQATENIAFNFDMLPSCGNGRGAQHKAQMEDHDFHGLKLGWTNGKGEDKEAGGHKSHGNHGPSDFAFDALEQSGSHLHGQTHNHFDNWSV